MDIAIRPASLSDKPILRNLLELCQHDYSEFDGADADEHGLFGYNYLDNYWTEPGRHPFLVRVSGKLAGFVLVRLLDSADEQPTYSIAEIFILIKYRRRGVGREVAHRIFDMFRGKWSVAQEEGNRPARAFWRKVIVEYTNGDFEEVHRQDDEWRGPIQKFNSRETARY